MALSARMSAFHFEERKPHRQHSSTPSVLGEHEIEVYPNVIMPIRSRSILAAMTLSALCACDPGEWFAPASPTDAELFPIHMINLHPSDFDSGPIIAPGPGTPAPTTMADLIDVAFYYANFSPCADLDQEFELERALGMLNAAKTHGVQVGITLPMTHQAALIVSDVPVAPAPIDCGEYQLESADEGENGNLEYRYRLFNEAGVPIPRSPSDLTQEFAAYWVPRAQAFMQQLNDGEFAEQIAYWYAPEELNPSGDQSGANQSLLWGLVDAVNGLSGPRHPLTSYTAPGFQSGEASLYRMLRQATRGDRDALELHIENPEQFSPELVAQLWDCEGSICSDPYPYWQGRTLRFARDEGSLMPLQRHQALGGYVQLYTPIPALDEAPGFDLPGNALDIRNRLAGYHISRMARETIELVRWVYERNAAEGGSPFLGPLQRAMHMPDLSSASYEMTPDEARHDLWVGLHHAQGIYLYNYRNAEENVAWEEAYRPGLTFIKSTLRPYLARGARSQRAVSISAAAGGPTPKQMIPGNYFANHPKTSGGHRYLAMPDYVPAHATTYRRGLYSYLILTNSYEQSANIEVHLPNVCDVTPWVGTPAEDLSFTNNSVTDRFSGIDGRVYRVRHCLFRRTNPKRSTPSISQ